MKRLLLLMLSVVLTVCAVAQTWVAPNVADYALNTPIPGDEGYLYHAGQNKFLGKGNAWGTHAMLTANISETVPYKLVSDSKSLLLHSAWGNVFVANNSGDCFVDYNGQSGSPYAWSITTDGNYFRILPSAENTAASGYRMSSFCLGWCPNNKDVDQSGKSLGTNYNVYLVNPNDRTNQVDWLLLTISSAQLYAARVRLYNALNTAQSVGLSTSQASIVYNNVSSTLTQVEAAATALESAIAQNALSVATQDNPVNATDYVTNPNFNGNVNGWIVDIPQAQNKGYQSAGYSNGSSYVSQFVEAWIPSGSYLGAGSILQTLNNMPEGKYVLEADVIACDQTGKYQPSEGVQLVAESQVRYATSVATESGKPQHYSLSFLAVGNDMTIGLRLLGGVTANWIAFDNVRLTYYGHVDCQTTSISVSPSEMDLLVGKTLPLKATIVTNDEMFNHAVWSSDNETVATVDAYGNVTGLHSGEAHITATAIETQLTSTALVRVSVNRPQGLVINEVMAANVDLYLDHSYNYGGWIELYNTGAQPIDLSGLYVSDGIHLHQMISNQGTVPSGGYHVLYFDHNAADGTYGGEAEKQVRFKLNVEGGTISVLDGDHEPLTSVTYPLAIPRCSYARLTDGGAEWGTTGQPTLANTNSTSTFATERWPAPQVSLDAGLFNSGTRISFHVDIPEGATLIYTTDGSTPSEQNGTVDADGQFVALGTTIYRFCLVGGGRLPSPVVTRSYITRNHDYYLPIISIATSPGNLYDDEFGVYTEGSNGVSGNGVSSPRNWNMDWERPVNVEYLVPETNQQGEITYRTALNQGTDFEVSGGWTRGYGNATVDGKYWPMRASFRLKTDKKYEYVNELDYPVFPGKPYNKYKCWQVRNGGNDTYQRIIDPALQQIVQQSGINIDCQDYQPAHVFFNGQYLGMLNIRESNNKHFGYSNLGIDTDDMDQFDLSNAQYNQKAGDGEAWLELQSRAALLANEQTEEAYQRVCELLDIDEYINYMALECYIGSGDWLTNVNNVKGYRSRSDGGKFRFVFFDADAAWGTDNMLSNLLYYNYGANVDDLFRNLMQYGPIRRQFVDAFCLIDGSVFEPSRCENIIQRIYNNTNTALGFEGSSSNKSMISTINAAHNGSRISNMASALSLSKPYSLTLSSNIAPARLLLNDREIPTQRFQGYAYDYQGEGITLTAKAPAGYTFLGWEQVGQSQSGPTTQTSYLIGQQSYWDYYDQGSMDNYDWTAMDFNASLAGWSNSQAPFGYASSTSKYMHKNSNTILDYGTNSQRKRPTYYFRKKFNLDSKPTDGQTFTFTYHVDDGVMVWVNGVEVGSYYYTSGSVYSDYTRGGHYEGDNPYVGTITIDNSLLRQGENVVAVALKNCSANSSDIYFEGFLTKQEMIEVEPTYFATTETITISDYPSGTYQLVAHYQTIQGDVPRWEAGATPVRINEVSAGNDIYINEYNQKNDWIELYNTTGRDIDLTGLYLSDNSRKPQKWQISAVDGVSTILPAYGTRVVWCDDLVAQEDLHAPFRLDNADGASVSIQSEDGTWADRLDYLVQERWTTYGRYPDGGNHEGILARPTIGSTNHIGTTEFSQVPTDRWEADDVTITLALEEGWNWTSHPLAEDVNRSRFTSYALCLRGQKSELYNDEELGWQGRLSALEAGQGYKLQMRRAVDVTLRGDLYNTAIPVVLHSGWNWIGVPLYNPTTLTAALQNYVATEGDQIVGLDAFATYADGQWVGSLSVLQPGHSYLLYAGQEQQLVWARLSSPRGTRVRRLEAARPQTDAPWVLQLHAYPNVMTMVAQVDTDDSVDLTDGHYYVGAFVGEECRGIASPSDDLLFANLHGDGGEQLSFRLINAHGDVYQSSQTVTLSPQVMQGSPAAPHRLVFGAGDIEDVIQSMPVVEARVVRVEYYNLQGQRIANAGMAGQVVIAKYIHADGTTTIKKLSR